MYTLKTIVNDANVLDFIMSVENERRKTDALRLLDIFQEITGLQPKMWGPSIIGYGEYRYKNKAGAEANWMRTGFSPRKQSMSIYIMDGFTLYAPLLEKLGKHKIGKSCLYINKLEDVRLEILRQLIQSSFLATDHWR